MRLELTKARAATDELFQLLTPQAFYQRPVEDRHRLVFYLGHVEAFDWNLLAAGEASCNPTFNALFARGIDPEPGQAPSDQPSDWPGIPEIRTYSQKVRDWIDQQFDHLDPVLLQMAVEHRYMHAETFAYLMHNLPATWKMQGPIAQGTGRPAPGNDFVRIGSGTAVLGQEPASFGWDNEFPRHEVPVQSFLLSRYKVSNGEYLDFVNATQASPSHFWEQRGGQWMWRGMFGLTPLPLDWPVWVTWSQANAYAEWRGKKLPSEAQWQLAAALETAVPQCDNFDFHRFEPSPVDEASAMIGNGWEWTRDIFAPFAGFQAHPAYAGYSADFFDHSHYVLKGASPRTAALVARPSFRNWFRPDYPHMYAGFRLVEE